jgi:ribosomal protein S13
MKKLIRIILVLLLSFLAIYYIIYLGIEHRKSIKDNFQMQLDLTLHEMTTQSATSLETEIKNKLNVLSEMSYVIAPDLNKNNISTVLQRLQKTVDRHGFKKMAIALQNGISYSTDNVTVNVSDREYFQRGMQGLSTVSKILDDRFDHTNINVFSVPIYRNKQIIGILFAIYSSAGLERFLNVSIFDKQGIAYVMDINGNIIINSYGSKNNTGKNLFEDIIQINDDTRDKVILVKKNINDYKSGSVKFINTTCTIILLT